MVENGRLIPHASYSIVRTLEDGTRQYGFCVPLRLPDGGGALVICLLSRYPWMTMFQEVVALLGTGAFPYNR